MNGYIYIIKNTINDKVYIGQTSRNIYCRWKQHINAALRGENQGVVLYNAMRKYGTENFYFEQIEECNLKEIDDREIYWIQQYNSLTPNGYNVRHGGEDVGRKEIYKIDDNNNIVGLYGSIMSASEENNIDASLLVKVCKGERNSCGGFKWAYKEDYDKHRIEDVCIKTFRTKVCQMNLDNGKLIHIWDSIGDASKSLNIDQTGISHCLSGKNKSAGGFGWCLYTDINNFKPYKREKTVIQIDLKTKEIIKEWNSAKEVASFLNKDVSVIRAAARGKRKTAYGFIWKYKE